MASPKEYCKCSTAHSVKTNKKTLRHLLRFSIYMRASSVKTCEFFLFRICFSQRFVEDPPRDRSCPHVCGTTQPSVPSVYTAPEDTSAVWSALREKMGCVNVKKAKYSWKGAPCSQPAVLTQTCFSHLVAEAGAKHHEKTDYLKCTKSCLCYQVLYGSVVWDRLNRLCSIHPAHSTCSISGTKNFL